MMIKAVAFSAILAVAGAAQAEPVAVVLHGKDAATIRTEIRKAAVDVCRAAQDPLSTSDDFNECVSASYQKAVWTVRRMSPASLNSAPAPTTLASR